MGVLAVYGYGLPEVNGKHSSQLNEIIQNVCVDNRWKTNLFRKSICLVLQEIITLFPTRSYSYW